MKFVAQALKAFVAAATAFLGGLATVLIDNKSVGDLTDGQWVTLALATLIAFAGVYGISNVTKG